MSRQTLRKRWREFWDPPDQILIDAGASGEMLVARIRVLVTAILIGIPVSQMLTQSERREVSASLVVASLAFATALVIYYVVRQRLYRPWLGFGTSVLDVTLVSAVLVTFLALDQPHIAVNSMIVFPIYFIALGATALRYDARISALTGLIAVAQYSFVVSYADMNWVLNDPRYVPFQHGAFSWNTQIGRLVLLGCAGLISTATVRRTQHLRWLSASDPLTKLMNRGFFDERMEEEAIRARRYRRPLSIAMIDIDRFKDFNDTNGHACGDEALCVTARTIRATVRRTDLVARYGGEEFIVAFPETPLPAALRKAEDMRAAVAAEPLRGRRGTSHVTVSIGVSSWPVDGDDLRSVIEVADDRLYHAKQDGRNQVIGPDHPTAAAG